MILVDEIYEWKEKLRKFFDDFVNSLVAKDGLGAVARAHIERRWRTSSWERITTRWLNSSLASVSSRGKRIESYT